MAEKGPPMGVRTIFKQGLEEFQIAKENQDIIIPIGSIGFAAKKILNEVHANPDDYEYLKDYVDILGTETGIARLVETVIFIVKEQHGIR